jgi:hypothetical protein
MRCLLRLLCVCALGVLPAIGCSETASEPCEPFNCPCRRPLDDYCESSACPTWEQAIAAAEQHAVQSGCDCGMWPADFGAGRCGDLRYVRENCGDEYIEFFDASGTLVAAYWWTDGCGLVCPGSCSVDYGFRPACELEPEQEFCDQND